METRRDFLKTAAVLPILGALPHSTTLPGPTCSDKREPIPGMIYAGKPISYWLAQLDRMEYEPEYEDVESLSVFASFGSAAVPHLIEAMGSHHPSLAAVQLQWMASPRTVQLLTDALEHRNWPVRAGAIRALSGIARRRDGEAWVTEALREALPLIARAKWDDNPHIAVPAETFVYKFGPAIEPRCPLPFRYLESEDPCKRELAVRWLRDFPLRAGEVVPLLEAKLEDREASVRWAAAETLSSFDSDHPGIVPVFLDGVLRGRFTYLGGFHAVDRIVLKILPDLQEALRSEEPKTRVAVANAFGWSESEAVLPMILRMLSDPSPEVRREAVLSLRSFDGRDIVPCLITALQDEDRKVRQHARRSLRGRPTPTDEMLPALAKLAESASPDARVAAMLAIDDLGREAATALPTLRRNLCHSDSRVRMAAAIVVGRLACYRDGADPSAAREGSSRYEVIEEDIDALVQLGSDLDTVARRLANNLSSDRLHLESVRLLELLDVRARPALHHLIRLLKSPDLNPCVRYGVQRCLAGIGRDAIQPLLDLLADDAAYVRTRAIRTLGLMTTQARLVVPPLLKIVEMGTPPERVLAIEALGNIGPAATPAVPLLSQSLRDQDLAVRRRGIVDVAEQEIAVAVTVQVPRGGHAPPEVGPGQRLGGQLVDEVRVALHRLEAAREGL